MTAPAQALAIIKRFEGCHRERADGQLEAYKCPANVWTIGWGSTGSDINAGTVWRQIKCDARLEADAGRFAAGVLRLSPGLAACAARLSAIVSFAYNLGLQAYAGSTLRRRVNEGDWEGAAREIRRWVNAGGRKLPGLVLRREVEAVLLEKGA